MKTKFAWIVAVALMSSVASAEDAKVGLVDMQRALQTTEAGKKARAQLEKEFKATKAQFDSEKASIEKMGEEFKKQSLVLSDEARAKKQAEVQERIMKFQEKASRSQQEIQNKERQMTGPMIEKIRTIVAELAKQKGYSVVLEKGEANVLFSLEKDDLTAEVVTAFNKQNKG
jgi:outer membrane protein